MAAKRANPFGRRGLQRLPLKQRGLGSIGSLLWLWLSTATGPAQAAAPIPEFAQVPAPSQRLGTSALPSAVAYNLGVWTLVRPEVAAPFQAMPIALQGWIARPAGTGPFPVVVILHGRHTGCHFTPTWANSTWPCPPGTETRFDQGFVYLAQTLAAQGYVALAIDLNGAYAYAYGATDANYNTLAIERSAQIIDAHLARLAQAGRAQLQSASSFGVDLVDQVDLSRLVLLGHSLGGGAAAHSALLRETHTSTEQIQQGLGRVSGLLLVAPTPSQAVATMPEAYALPDVPTSVLLGGCDRDIYDFSSLYYFETAAADPNRQSSLSSTLIPGANHNFFNPALQDDDYAQQPDAAPLCDRTSSQRLDRQAQETFLIHYASDFIQAVFQATPGALPNLAARQAAPKTLYSVSVLTNLSPGASHQRALFSLTGTEFDPALPARVTAHGSLAVQVCPALRSCGPHWRPRPRFPSVLRLSWQQGSGQLRADLPSTDQDVQAFASLQLRVAVDATDALNDDIAQAFAVVLTDRQGRSARVEIPPGTPALKSYAPDPRWGYQGLPIYPTAIRIPLAQFEGVDLGAIATVTLVFDQTPRGVIYLSDLAWLKDIK